MGSSAADIAVVVPVFNERVNLPALLEHVQASAPTEFVLVDGGSTDGSWEWLQQVVPHNSIQSRLGRAEQMNVGAANSTAKLLLFLHADTRLPSNALSEVARGLQNHCWGRFNIQFSDGDWRMRIIAVLINWRSAITGVATGDQAIFMRRDVFHQLGGFPSIALMEDIALTKQLKQQSKPFCSRSCVQTSARRWMQRGVAKTVLLMWGLRLAYFLGVSPARLEQYYRQVR